MKARLLDDSDMIDKYISTDRITSMKSFVILALLILSACATKKVASTGQITKQKASSKPVTILVMTEKVFNFEPNATQLDAEDQKELHKMIADILKHQKRYRRIEIVGHSDRTGTEDENLDVSKERAITVLDAMKDAGIDRKKIRTSWLAGTDPVEDAIDSSLNRRVEIRLFEKKSQ